MSTLARARIGTRAKFRHYVSHPDAGPGARRLVWASGLPDDFGKLEVVRGSLLDRIVGRDQPFTDNALADEGEKDILDVYLDDVAVRGTTYLRLYNDTPAETDTLATLTGEVTGTGYDGIALTRGTDWPDPSLDSGDMKTTSVLKTWTAGGAWTAATQLAWSTVQNGTSGLFLGWVALSATRTLANTDTLDVTLGVKLS